MVKITHRDRPLKCVMKIRELNSVWPYLELPKHSRRGSSIWWSSVVDLVNVRNANTIDMDGRAGLQPSLSGDDATE